MMELVLADDMSDTANLCRSRCWAAKPEPEVKAKVWNDLIDPANDESLYIRRAKMGGFYARSQIGIVAPYFEEFYNVLSHANKQMSYRNFDQFFRTMLPFVGEIKDEHIVKLVCLKQDTPDTEKVFMTMLQDGIELLVRAKEIRALNNQN